MSAKHLNRYVNEFSGRHNQRSRNTVDQISAMVRRMDGRRLRYRDFNCSDVSIMVIYHYVCRKQNHIRLGW